MTKIIIITKGENKRPFCPEFQANNPMKNAIKNSCQCSRLCLKIGGSHQFGDLCSMVVCQAVVFLSVQGSK